MKLADHDFHETCNMYPNLNANLSNAQKFGLNKMNEIKNYFLVEIKERDLMNKRLVLSVATGSIASFAIVTGAPVRMMSASRSLAFSITTGFVKKF